MAHISFRYLDPKRSGRLSCMGEEGGRGGARRLVGWVRAPPVFPTVVPVCQHVSIWPCENLGIQSAELGAPQQPSGPDWLATWSSGCPVVRLVSRQQGRCWWGGRAQFSCPDPYGPIVWTPYHHDDDGISQRCGSARVERAPSGTDRAAGGCPPAHDGGRQSRRVVNTSACPLTLASAQVDSVPHVLPQMAEIWGGGMAMGMEMEMGCRMQCSTVQVERVLRAGRRSTLRTFACSQWDLYLPSIRLGPNAGPYSCI